MSDPHAVAKQELHDYLRAAREAMLWKLDGVGEYDVRRPMVRTGTNLLGLVKHMAGVEAGYLGLCFENPFEGGLPGWEPDAEPNADMWATADESREEVVAIYRRVWEHCDQTIEVLGLGSPGRVPWWPAERADVNLHQILVHLIAETNRHAGHADILRETIDGASGLRASNPNLPDVDETWWVEYRERLEAVAREAGGHRTPDRRADAAQAGGMAALAPMQPDEVEDVVAGLQQRGLIANLHRPGLNRVCVRVVLPDGSEALWDTDGALGLEAQVMADGMLVGFVPTIPGSWQYDVSQTIDAIANADYGLA